MKSQAVTLSAAAFLILAIAWVEGVLDGDQIEVTSIQGKSVTLRCTSATRRSTPPKRVEWMDLVHNSGPAPQRIFTTRRNPEMNIDPSHPNAVNYRVDPEHTLTISNVNKANDVGQYICKSHWDKEDEESNDYYLSVATMPTCSGETDLTEGDGQTQLECEMLFSGAQPILQWYHGDELLQSEDDFEVGTARKKLTVKASHQHDKSKYTCKVSFGDMKESCSLKMNISYLVQDVKITPDKEKIRAGEEVRCSAKGNPTPDIVIHPEGQGGSGHGWRTLLIEEELIGEEVEIRCSASNRVGEESETLTISKNFQVTDKVKHTNKHMNDAREPNDEQAHKHADTRPVVGSESKTNSARQLNLSGCLTVLLPFIVYSSVTVY